MPQVISGTPKQQDAAKLSAERAVNQVVIDTPAQVNSVPALRDQLVAAIRRIELLEKRVKELEGGA